MSENSGTDQLLQQTCEEIVTAIATVIDAEPAASKKVLRLPDGPELGRQISIDATEPGGPANTCRMSILNTELAPAGEVARIEYEHERQGKYGIHKVYSVQSVRRQAGRLVLLENFLADNPALVREADFRPIASEAYAKKSVLKSVNDWSLYRAWQLQETRRS